MPDATAHLDVYVDTPDAWEGLGRYRLTWRDVLVPEGMTDAEVVAVLADHLSR